MFPLDVERGGILMPSWFNWETVAFSWLYVASELSTHIYTVTETTQKDTQTDRRAEKRPQRHTHMRRECTDIQTNVHTHAYAQKHRKKVFLSWTQTNSICIAM